LITEHALSVPPSPGLVMPLGHLKFCVNLEANVKGVNIDAIYLEKALLVLLFDKFGLAQELVSSGQYTLLTKYCHDAAVTQWNGFD
jgi:hypothetical protein